MQCSGHLTRKKCPDLRITCFPSTLFEHDGCLRRTVPNDGGARSHLSTFLCLLHPPDLCPMASSGKGGVGERRSECYAKTTGKLTLKKIDQNCGILNILHRLRKITSFLPSPTQTPIWGYTVFPMILFPTLVVDRTGNLLNQTQPNHT
jgi:hypothetical protein